MSTILISINPQHVEKILSGIKKCEYRRTVPKRKVDKIVIYETAPTKKVVCECLLKEIKILPKEQLWNETKDISGSTHERFSRYFKDREIAVGYIIDKITIYKEPKELKDLGINFVPQSYIYLD
jgi:predicted transcriptional regulator